MVFNNAGRLSNVQFKLNNTVLECVHRYKYLGLTENKVTNLNSSQYMIHHRSLKLDTLSLGYVIRSLCIEWEERRSIGKSPVQDIFFLQFYQ
jgi:hypothetical protein